MIRGTARVSPHQLSISASMHVSFLFFSFFFLSKHRDSHFLQNILLPCCSYICFPAPATECNKLRPSTGLRGISVRCCKSIAEVRLRRSVLVIQVDSTFSTSGAEVESVRQVGGENITSSRRCKCWFYICGNIKIVTSMWLFLSSAFQRLTLLHVNSNQCLDMPSEEDKMVPTLRDCNNSRSQQWLLRNMTLSVWSLILPLPSATFISTSPGSAHPHQVALHAHHTPRLCVRPDSGWGSERPMIFLRCRRRLFVQPAISFQAAAIMWAAAAAAAGTAALMGTCQCRQSGVWHLRTDSTVIKAVTGEPAARPPVLCAARSAA